MSNSPSRLQAIALACAAGIAQVAYAEPAVVQVKPATTPIATVGKASPAKPSASAVPSPIQFELRGELGADGHVHVACHETPNPAFVAARERARLPQPKASR